LPLDPLFLATGVEAALAAAPIQKQYFRRDPKIQKKGRIDLVTAADLEVERMFRALIADRFPSHSVLGEEATSATGSPDAPCRWIIDPVDGTTNFAHGLALFCVSIALEIEGRVELGVVYDPMSEELFTAERGEGARLNGAPLTVSSTETVDDALLVTGFPYNVREERREQVAIFTAFSESRKPCGGWVRQRWTSAMWQPAASTVTGRPRFIRGTWRPAGSSCSRLAARSQASTVPPLIHSEGTSSPRMVSSTDRCST
jgi:fructose-1,6-bisphosphatase/inositol monophosphatase family enzyme